MHSPISTLLFIYGSFLILCGIVAVTFIGLKARTALLSGGTSGTLAIVIAYLASTGLHVVAWFGLALSFGLTIVFSWRAAKTLFRLFELIPQRDSDLNGKGIAFLIIGLMAIISILVTMIQCALLFF